MPNLAVKIAAPPARRSRGRPTASESQALQEAIAEAAIREFEMLGFEVANVSAIAAAAGVTKATIYRLFGSKEQLFKLAIRKALKQVANSQREFAETDDPRSLLCEAADRISTSYLTGSVGALWHSVLAVKKRFPDFHDEILALLREESIASSLAARLAQMHARGILNVPDPLMTAHHFSLLAGQGRELALPPRAGAAREAARIEQVINMFLKAHQPDQPVGN